MNNYQGAALKTTDKAPAIGTLVVEFISYLDYIIECKASDCIIAWTAVSTAFVYRGSGIHSSLLLNTFYGLYGISGSNQRRRQSVPTVLNPA